MQSDHDGGRDLEPEVIALSDATHERITRLTRNLEARIDRLDVSAADELAMHTLLTEYTSALASFRAATARIQQRLLDVDAGLRILDRTHRKSRNQK